MAAGFPVKANYATGDVLSAANMNDLSATLNYINPTGKTNGYVLTRNSAATGGLEWAAAGSGGSSDFVKITSNTFTSATTFSVNDCFSATYDYYKIYITTTATAGDTLRMRLRVSGSDASGSNYNNHRVYGQGSTVAGYDENSQTAFAAMSLGTGNAGSAEILVSNPYLTKTTNIFSNVTYNGQMLDLFTGGHTLTTSYTGFTMYPGSGNITGTYIVYGLKA